MYSYICTIIVMKVKNFLNSRQILMYKLLCNNVTWKIGTQSFNNNNKRIYNNVQSISMYTIGYCNNRMQCEFNNRAYAKHVDNTYNRYIRTPWTLRVSSNCLILDILEHRTDLHMLGSLGLTRSVQVESSEACGTIRLVLRFN